MICKECGAQIPEGSEFCPDCGAKLEETLIGEVAETKEETVEMQEELQEETTEETPESATEEEAEPSADSVSAEESLSETELQSTEADWQTEQDGDCLLYTSGSEKWLRFELRLHLSEYASGLAGGTHHGGRD